MASFCLGRGFKPPLGPGPCPSTPSTSPMRPQARPFSSSGNLGAAGLWLNPRAGSPLLHPGPCGPGLGWGQAVRPSAAGGSGPQALWFLLLEREGWWASPSSSQLRRRWPGALVPTCVPAQAAPSARSPGSPPGQAALSSGCPPAQCPLPVTSPSLLTPGDPGVGASRPCPPALLLVSTGTRAAEWGASAPALVCHAGREGPWACSGLSAVWEAVGGLLHRPRPPGERVPCCGPWALDLGVGPGGGGSPKLGQAGSSGG